MYVNCITLSSNYKYHVMKYQTSYRTQFNTKYYIHSILYERHETKYQTSYRTQTYTKYYIQFNKVRTAYSNAFAAAPQESATSKHVLRRMQYCSATFPGFTIRYLEEEE